jgi:hypothetical protein
MARACTTYGAVEPDANSFPAGQFVAQGQFQTDGIARTQRTHGGHMGGRTQDLLASRRDVTAACTQTVTCAMCGNSACDLE